MMFPSNQDILEALMDENYTQAIAMIQTLINDKVNRATAQPAYAHYIVVNESAGRIGDEDKMIFDSISDAALARNESVLYGNYDTHVWGAEKIDSDILEKVYADNPYPPDYEDDVESDEPESPYDRTWQPVVAPGDVCVICQAPIDHDEPSYYCQSCASQSSSWY